MRGRRIAGALVALVLTLGCLVGCGSMELEDTGSAGGATQTSSELSERVASGLSVAAERGSGSLSIQRSASFGAKPKGIESGTWTVLVYLCGSDLESESGAATRDLSEMVAASGSERVSFVVETGGAKRWRSNVPNKYHSRYLIQDGSIREVERVKDADMGDPNTLASFLAWGCQNFPAEHMGAILWDHGGGSISGVCFDERNRYDALTLRELDAAFATASKKMWKKLDFVGFDACLMSTIELANVMATYADYMYASQESEPATGWDYGPLIEYLAKHPNATGREVGRALCDDYLASVSGAAARDVTLSVVDLSEIDDLIQDFYRFSQEMYEAGSDQGTLAAMTRGISGVDSFGTNNRLEGYTNMVDLGGVVDACADVTPSAAEVRTTLKAAVPYQVRGRAHKNVSGLSIYYPVRVGSSSELTAFQSVAINPSYLSYVDRLAHGATYAGTSSSTSYTTYQPDSWFDETDVWSLLMGLDELYSAMGSMRSPDPRWAYVDERDTTSQVVSFAEKPQVDDEGVYWFELAPDAIDYVATVSGRVWREADGQTLALGETFDIWGDWDTGRFEDGFDGKWLALPDGQLLTLAVVEATVDEAVFAAPVTLNGHACFLRLVQDLETGAVSVEGVWDGVGEQGQAGRLSDPPAAGDVICPLATTDDDAKAGDLSAFDVVGEAVEVGEGGLVIDYQTLPQGTYRYAFDLTDVFGDHYVSEQIQLDVEEDGIYFTE